MTHAIACTSEPFRQVDNWTSREIERYGQRISLFRRRGMPVERVVVFAERLTARDRDRDDRRACIECAHLQRDGGCFAARRGWLGPRVSPSLTPIPDALGRCPCFDWQKP